MYVFEDFKNKRLMLLEEKTRGGVLQPAQRLTFRVVDELFQKHCDESG